MKDVSSFTFKPYSNKYVSDLQNIFWTSFRKKMPVDYLLAKYDTSAFGFSPVATIAYEKQKVVAFYGAIPQLFGKNNSQFMVAHACDSFTDTNYHRRGLHHNLAKLSYELMVKQNIKMVYAYHSENTFRSTKKLNWKEHITMSRFHIKNKTLPIAKIYDKVLSKSQRANSIGRKLKKHLAHVDHLPFIKDGRAHQIYSADFLSYKDSFNQHFVLELNGCLFYLKFDVIIKIGCFFYDDIEQLKMALIKLQSIQKNLGYTEILFQVDTSSQQYEDLKTILKPLPSWKVGYLAFDSKLKIEEFTFNYADLDTF